MDEEYGPSVKVWYRRNLKMTPGKLAAQVGHAVARLYLPDPYAPCRIVVLAASDRKFRDLCHHSKVYDREHYIHEDAGTTEVDPGTLTVIAIVEPEDERQV